MVLLDLNALAKVWSISAQQSFYVHKTARVLDNIPKAKMHFTIFTWHKQERVLISLLITAFKNMLWNIPSRWIVLQKNKDRMLEVRSGALVAYQNDKSYRISICNSQIKNEQDEKLWKQKNNANYDV